MQDMQDIYFLTSIEQVKTIADPLRLRIVELLIHKAMTTTQIGEALGETSAKTHYHVHALERIGVIKLVETREKGGILEKYYRSIARDINVAPEVLNSAPADEITTILQGWFHTIEQTAIKAFMSERSTFAKGSTIIQLASTVTYANVEEMKTLLGDINALLEKYQEPRGIENEQEWSISLIAHRQMATPVDPTAEPPASTPAPLEASIKPSRSFVLGALSLNRTDLEKAIAKGHPMEINVTGFCSFANDVTPDLIERGISRFRQRGILTASPEVREALKRKSGT
jgi:DNA-binding transcriptional ArsR family regulator